MSSGGRFITVPFYLVQFRAMVPVEGSGQACSRFLLSDTVGASGELTRGVSNTFPRTSEQSCFAPNSRKVRSETAQTKGYPTFGPPFQIVGPFLGFNSRDNCNKTTV